MIEENKKCKNILLRGKGRFYIQEYRNVYVLCLVLVGDLKVYGL